MFLLISRHVVFNFEASRGAGAYSVTVNMTDCGLLHWCRGKGRCSVPPLNTECFPEFGGKWGMKCQKLQLGSSFYPAVCGIQREAEKI